MNVATLFENNCLQFEEIYELVEHMVGMGFDEKSSYIQALSEILSTSPATYKPTTQIVVQPATDEGEFIVVRGDGQHIFHDKWADVLSYEISPDTLEQFGDRQILLSAIMLIEMTAVGFSSKEAENHKNKIVGDESPAIF